MQKAQARGAVLTLFILISTTLIFSQQKEAYRKTGATQKTRPPIPRQPRIKTTKRKTRATRLSEGWIPIYRLHFVGAADSQQLASRAIQPLMISAQPKAVPRKPCSPEGAPSMRIWHSYR